jgi:transposase-like protein
MVRLSLNYVSWKQRKDVADDLKSIYQAPIAELAEKNLEAFAAKWEASHPCIAKSWRNNWERIILLFSYPTDIRKAIYTTNTIESLNLKAYLRNGLCRSETGSLRLINTASYLMAGCHNTDMIKVAPLINLAEIWLYLF